MQIKVIALLADDNSVHSPGVSEYIFDNHLLVLLADTEVILEAAHNHINKLKFLLNLAPPPVYFVAFGDHKLGLVGCDYFLDFLILRYAR